MKKTPLFMLFVKVLIFCFITQPFAFTAFSEEVAFYSDRENDLDTKADLPPEPENTAEVTSGAAIIGTTTSGSALKGAFLITGSEIEIEYGAEVLSNEDAQEIFTIYIDNEPVEWEFLSYFDFGPYKDRGGVVNVRLKNSLDVGKPRVQRRAVQLFANTQNSLGPAAAARIRVEADTQTADAAFKPFYGEIQLGHMSQVEAWGATNAGNSTSDNFTGPIGSPRYTTDYVTKQLGEGVNGLMGRCEYLNIPVIDTGLQVHVVGSSQSVYEIPAYRELYKSGETDDVYTRTGIEFTTEKAIIATTADEVMRHDSDAKDENGAIARPRNDYFDFGEHFFNMYYDYGVLEGSKLYPLGQFNDWDEYRYDVHLERAYEKAKEQGKWAGTAMMESVKNYYLYGVMIHFEMIPESDDGSWQYDRFPINTREELHDYDIDLYRAICGIHGRYHYFTGTPEQAGSFTNDTMKNRHPWFWRSQADNYTVDEDGDPVEREPLKIEYVRIISDRQIEIKFNREISTITPAATAGNWRVYKNGAPISGISPIGGYAWRTITLQVPSGAANRLDNGKPYGRGFAGFTQKDIDERKISSGGWISNNQQPGTYPLDFGQFVSLEDAIRDWGAGASGTIEVEYIGSTDVKDWAGNVLEKNVKDEAEFLPYVGNAYRSPLTGVYFYSDTVVEKDTIKAGAYMYDTLLSNNRTVTYPMSAGGEDFPDNPAAVVGTNTLHNNADRNYVNSIPKDFAKNPVVYDRVGQRIADGSVAVGGGMQIIGGSHFGHHAAMQPSHRNQINSSFHVWLYVEGWGGTIFQADEVLILKDTQLTRYKNENLVLHEGGHGVDSYTGPGNYADFVRYDTTAAWVTAVAPENGRRWWNQYDTEGAYLRNRDEYVSTASTFWAGAMRESFLGINDGVWTPINTREEMYRYDPYGSEALNRAFFNGELGLWYHDAEGRPRVGDPEYRVLVEDWEVLKEQYPKEFGHWTSEKDLIAWGAAIPEVARNNPYTGEHNPLINWVSWNTPNVWNIGLLENPAVPTNKFDFKGRDAYYPAEPSPTKNQTHPFFREGGVVKPERPAEIEALVTPVKGKIVDGSVSVPRPVLVQFQLKNYDKAVTANNAQTTFVLKADGQLKHFYFYDYKEENDTATVTLRLDWPLEEGQEVDVQVADGIKVTVDGKDEIMLSESLAYSISIEDFKDINAISLEFEIDNDIAKFKDLVKTSKFQVLRAAGQLEDIIWRVDEVNNKLNGKITLFSTGLISSEDILEIIKLSFEPQKIGNASFKLKDIEIAGVDENHNSYFHSLSIANSEIITSVTKQYSVYDVNRDNKVNLLDISEALSYYQSRAGEDNWNKAKLADVNKDGVVNILDVIEIYTNYTFGA